MPSNLIGALKSYSLPGAMTATSEDPVDWATLFAGLRSSVPLTLLLGSREANAGEDEWARRQPRYEQPRNYTAEDLQRDLAHEYPRYVGGAAGEFYKMLQQEQIKQMLKDAKAKENAPRGPRREYPQPTPTQFMRGYAVGGPVLPDHTQPDMSDGGQLLGDPHLYAGGGGVKKTLDEMEAEMIRKGVKTTTRPEMSRRAFFGLPTGSSFPMAKIPTQELEKLRNAPSITEKTTTVTPSPNAPKIEETVKKVSETPVSRRTVLKSASGQMLKGVLPDVGVPGVGDIAKEVAESAAPTASPLTHRLAIVMKMLKEGRSEREIADSLRISEGNAERMAGIVQDPYGNLPKGIRNLSTPSGAFYQITGTTVPYGSRNDPVIPEHLNPLYIRPQLRQMRDTDPEAYRRLIDAAKDVSMTSIEGAMEAGLKQNLIDRYMRGEISLKDLPNRYLDKIDEINASRFGY